MRHNGAHQCTSLTDYFRIGYGEYGENTIRTRTRHRLLVTASLLFLLSVVAFFILPKPPARYQPSDYGALVPELDSDFSDYIAESRTRIRQALREYYFREGESPFLGAYTLDQVARMRAPFEYAPASNCDESGEQPRQGILMLHGLTDSPYLLRPIASNLAFRFPCALIRSVLTPGHGTVPGDLLTSNLSQWRATVDYGVQSFAGQVDELTVLGYSNGAALALDYLNRNPSQSDISKLILVSPGIQSANDSAWLAPWLKWIMPWINEYPDEDAVKYESFPTHAAGEFYRISSAVRNNTYSAHAIPSRVLVSGMDTTVNARASIDYYCTWLDNGQSKLMLFKGEAVGPLPEECDTIELLTYQDPDERFRSFSHVALAVPASDSHYGLDGAYPACLTYFQNAERYQQCRADHEETVYGESSLLDGQRMVDGKLLRRSTFNPLFDEVIEELTCFISGDC